MFCPSCGTEIQDGEVFCYKCGTRLQTEDNDSTVAIFTKRGAAAANVAAGPGYPQPNVAAAPGTGNGYPQPNGGVAPGTGNGYPQPNGAGIPGTGNGYAAGSGASGSAPGYGYPGVNGTPASAQGAGYAAGNGGAFGGGYAAGSGASGSAPGYGYPGVNGTPGSVPGYGYAAGNAPDSGYAGVTAPAAGTSAQTAGKASKKASGKKARQAAVSSAPGAKPKKRGKGLVIAGVVVLVLLLLGGGGFLVFWNMPKVVVVRGLRNTVMDTVNEESGLASYLGLKKILGSAKDGALKQTFSAEVDMETYWNLFTDSMEDNGYDEDADEMRGMFDGVKLGGNLIYEKYADDAAYLELSAQIADMDTNLARMYGDRTQLLMASPDLFDGSLYLDMDNLRKQIGNGQFFDMMEDTYGGEFSEEQREVIQWLADMSGEEFPDLISLYRKYSSDSWKNLAGNMEIEKADPQTFEIGGKDRSCKGYSVTLQAEDVSDVAVNLIQFLLDEAVSELKLDELSSFKRNVQLPGRKDYSVLRKEIEEMLEDGVSMTLYFGPQDRLVSVQWRRKLKLDGEKVTMDLELDLLGQKNPLDEVALTCTMKTGDGEGYEIELTKMMTDNGEELEEEISLDVADCYMSYYSEQIEKYETRMNFSFYLDEESGECDLTLDVSYKDSGRSGEKQSLTVSGLFDNVQKGKSFTLTIDKRDYQDWEGDTIADMLFELFTRRSLRRWLSYMVGDWDVVSDALDRSLSENDCISVSYGLEAADSMSSAEDIQSMKKRDVLDMLEQNNWDGLASEIEENAQKWQDDITAALGLD